MLVRMCKSEREKSNAKHIWSLSQIQSYSLGKRKAIAKKAANATSLDLLNVDCIPRALDKFISNQEFDLCVLVCSAKSMHDSLISLSIKQCLSYVCISLYMQPCLVCFGGKVVYILLCCISPWQVFAFSFLAIQIVFTTKSEKNVIKLKESNWGNASTWRRPTQKNAAPYQTSRAIEICSSQRWEPV